MPAASASIVTWSAEDIKSILAAMDPHRLRLLVWLALNTGGRISELLALKYSDITTDQIIIDKQIIHDKKIADNGNSAAVLGVGAVKSAGSVRAIPYTAETAAEIEKHKTWHFNEMCENGYTTDFVFTTSGGRIYERRNIYHALQRVYKVAGVDPHRFHTYRATFASRLAAAGVPAHVLAGLMGHSSVNVTAKYYIAVTDEQKRQSIARFNSDIIAIINGKAHKNIEK